MAVTRKIPARFNHATKEIVLYRWFAEKAEYPGTPEYKTLIAITNDFPTYSVVVRDKINKKEGQEHYNGLTYEYMKWYIEKYEPKETRDEVLSELKYRIDISKCHSTGRRYPAIRKWFLEKYEAVKTFGMTDAEKEEFEEYKKQKASEVISEESQEEESNINTKAEQEEHEEDKVQKDSDIPSEDEYQEEEANINAEPELDEVA